jgi:putative ABC transport system permease protein
MFNYYLKLSWLSLRKTPIISSLMVLAIAIGIGVSMTTLTVYHMMNVNPMGEKGKQLFAVQLQTKDDSGDDEPPSQLTYQDAMALRESNIPVRHTPMFKSGYSVQMEDQRIAPFSEAARITDRVFFELFDIEFIYGAVWDKSVDEVGIKVAVITQTLNNKLFGGQDSVGKQVVLDGKLYTISGVIADFNASPKFYDLNNRSFGSGEGIYLPFSLTPIEQISSWGNNNGWKHENITTFEQKLTSEAMWLQYWVELDTADKKQQYEDFLAAYIKEQKQLGRFSRDDAAGYLSTVQQWLDTNEVVGDDNSVLVGLSFMFLVVCVVNTIGLLLAKFLRRASEVGVRRALGASQLEVFKQHLIEVSLIGFFGGLLGLVFTSAGLLGLRSIYQNYDRLTEMDLSMVVAAFVIAILSSVVAGLYPAYRICKTNPATHLKTQ